MEPVIQSTHKLYIYWFVPSAFRTLITVNLKCLILLLIFPVGFFKLVVAISGFWGEDEVSVFVFDMKVLVWFLFWKMRCQSLSQTLRFWFQKIRCQFLSRTLRSWFWKIRCQFLSWTFRSWSWKMRCQPLSRSLRSWSQKTRCHCLSRS